MFKYLNSYMIHALVVFSGGLDSILVVKILEEQGIKVTALSFESYFFDTEESKKTAEQLGIDLIVKDISDDQLDTVKNPAHGYGSALNPCIDCHGLMFRVAGELVKLTTSDGKKFDIIATGEVLGQRPFSQNSASLKKVEKLAGVDILRPLSAKLLPRTSYEEQGLVNREKLLDISGKSRRRQLELVEEYGVEYYPSPAGGCRLTENEFGIKVKQLLENDGKDRELSKVDFELLRVGRHYWLRQDTRHKIQDTSLTGRQATKSQSPKPKQYFKEQNSSSKKSKYEQQANTHIILGKNHEENQQLKKSVEEGDALIELKDVMGPVALIFRKEGADTKENEELMNKVKRLMLDRTKSQDKNIEDVEWISN